MKTSEQVPISDNEDAPPLAPAFPTVPGFPDPGRYMAKSKVAPQFGPAYGMAPTADVLTPISTMPELPPEPEPKSSKWVASSGLAAALLVIAALAFYYGPFRPRATSATRTSTPTASVADTKPQLPETAAPAAPAASATQAKPAANPTRTTASPQAAAPAKAPVPAQTPVTAPIVAKATPPAPPVQSVPVKPVPAAAPTPVKAPVQPVPVKAVPQVAAAHPGLRHAVLKASSLNWVSVCSDTKSAFAKVLQQGDTIEIDFQRTAIFHIGTAGASQIEIDGKSIGPVGAPGEVKVLELSSEGARTLGPGVSAESQCGLLRAAAKK